MATRGRLITIEGIDGAGKTTLATHLVAARPQLTSLREPGGVALAERLREIAQDPGAVIGARAEALLFAAARAQLVEERVRPLLEAGQSILLDRFTDSLLAYQGGGGELGTDAMAALNAFATGGLTPDLTLYLRTPLAVAAARRSGVDRLERAPRAFFERVADAYEELAARDPARIAVLDGTRSADEIALQALELVDRVA